MSASTTMHKAAISAVIWRDDACNVSKLFILFPCEGGFGWTFQPITRGHFLFSTDKPVGRAGLWVIV